MDRPVQQSLKTKRNLKWIFYSILCVGALYASWQFLGNQLKTSIDPKDFITAKVEKGNIESTISAAGEVIPIYEQVLSSPIKATIQEVLKPIGTKVRKGEAILVLDKSESLLEFEKLTDQLELRKNEITRLKLNLKKELFDLEISDSIKALNVQRLTADRDNTKYLLDIGGATQEQMDEAELQLKIALLEKKQLDHSLKTKKQSTETEIFEKDLQAKIQGHAITELEQKLQKADIKAQRSGVLTWVNDRIGLPVNPGETLARLADLGFFKVMGSISDIYADKIKIGQRAIVTVNDQPLSGTINNIRPTVENNIITFEVQLDQSNHEALRPNMKVEVYIILASKSETLRIANGPAFNGKAKQKLFLLQDGRAIQKEVQMGLSSFEYVEVLSELRLGDEIIISDMKQYEHLSEITIK
ncbi:MAG: efflux RND transporter periplasmic adaptor subunit [Saprospiraceae bacterium]|nr:efflux RND transporter periplasmic adaptor subunit [Saprospiraceae bacterium]